jgi:hypothetical protein
MQTPDVLRNAPRADARRTARGRTTTRIRYLLMLQGVSFVLAGLVHRGVVVRGYEHAQAAVAETVIGAVLLGGLVFTWLRPHWVRAVGVSAQGFALLGTLVGVVMISVGVGPRTAPDVAYHAAMLMLLFAGLTVTVRSGRDA